jgi:hypothetical protein
MNMKHLGNAAKLILIQLENAINRINKVTIQHETDVKTYSQVTSVSLSVMSKQQTSYAFYVSEERSHEHDFL